MKNVLALAVSFVLVASCAAEEEQGEKQEQVCLGCYAWDDPEYRHLWVETGFAFQRPNDDDSAISVAAQQVVFQKIGSPSNQLYGFNWLDERKLIYEYPVREVKLSEPAFSVGGERVAVTAAVPGYLGVAGLIVFETKSGCLTDELWPEQGFISDVIFSNSGEELFFTGDLFRRVVVDGIYPEYGDSHYLSLFAYRIGSGNPVYQAVPSGLNFFRLEGINKMNELVYERSGKFLPKNVKVFNTEYSDVCSPSTEEHFLCEDRYWRGGEGERLLKKFTSSELGLGFSERMVTRVLRKNSDGSYLIWIAPNIEEIDSARIYKCSGTPNSSYNCKVGASMATFSSVDVSGEAVLRLSQDSSGEVEVALDIEFLNENPVSSVNHRLNFGEDVSDVRVIGLKRCN